MYKQRGGVYKQRGGGVDPPTLRRGIRKADTFEKYRDVISRSNLVLILFLMQVSLKSINMDKQSLYLFGTPFSRASSRDVTSSQVGVPAIKALS
jgi:hypothetical protein